MARFKFAGWDGEEWEIKGDMDDAKKSAKDYLEDWREGKDTVAFMKPENDYVTAAYVVGEYGEDTDACVWFRSVGE